MNLATVAINNVARNKEVTFQFHPDPRMLVVAIVFGALMGVAGGFFPALRAARVSAVEAMRA